MANPPVNAPDQPTRRDRLRRELRNPSMTTVVIIVVAVLAIPMAILVPSWVDTTRQSLEDRSEAEAFREEFGLISSSVLVPSLIVPWMLDQIERMEQADSPADWSFTTFVAGPCDSTNLSQLPAGDFADSIDRSCKDMAQIQVDHADECPSIQVCNFSSRAMTRLDGVRTHLLDVFSDANFVIPYLREEETGQ